MPNRGIDPHRMTLIGTPDTGVGYGFRSLMPPILAIALALSSRQVVLALLGGILLGASYLEGGAVGTGLLRTLDDHLVGALADSDHASILLFSLTLGGMVGIMGAAGGAAGIVQKISRWAKSPRSGQIATWAMGIFIFFDDYANTLIVGNTFRPEFYRGCHGGTDRLDCPDIYLDRLRGRSDRRRFGSRGRDIECQRGLFSLHCNDPLPFLSSLHDSAGLFGRLLEPGFRPHVGGGETLQEDGAGTGG